MKWEKVKLGDVCTFKTGKTPSTKKPEYFNGSIQWYTPGDIGKEIYLTKSERTITEQALKDNQASFLPKNSLLITCIGEIGRVGILSAPATCNQQITGLTFCDTVLAKYAYYWFIANRNILRDRSNNAVVPILNNAALKDITFTYPPLHIQEQIANTLDKADALRKKDQALLQKYDELAQSIFYDMFGDPVRNEKGWLKKTIRDISSEVKYGTSSPAEENGMYPYLRMNNITHGGELDLSSLKYINVSEKDLEKYGTKNGDLLFNRTNSKELVGKTTVVNINTPMVLAGYLIRVRLNEQANPTFVSAFLNTKESKTTLRGMCKSIVGMANINAQELQDISIILPPRELQDAYQEKVKKVIDQKKYVLQTLEKSSNMFDEMSSVYFS